MKFLPEVCRSSRSLRHFLTECGHDVGLVSEVDPRAPDEVVLAMAHEEGSIVITEDKDFGELIAAQRRPHLVSSASSSYQFQNKSRQCKKS